MTKAPSIKEAPFAWKQINAYEACNGTLWRTADEAMVESKRSALATLQPSGGRREAIARIIAKHIEVSDATLEASGGVAAVNGIAEAAGAILASGLVQDEAAIAGNWHTTGWDRARNSGRILLVWREFAGVREHVELGRYSGSKAAWVNTYGHPFHADPDGWAPLLPFATETAIRADEREKCALLAEHECYAAPGKQIAVAIRTDRNGGASL